jgi:hypothetical protein
MSGSAMELELRELGRHLSWPPVPDLTASVGAELERAPVVPLSRRRRPRRALALAAAAVLVVAGLLAVSPGLRAALLEIFRLPGARIEVEPTPFPMPAGPQTLEDVVPGSPVTLAEARATAAFPVVFPEALGPPDRVVLAGSGSEAVVSMAWAARPGLPTADETGYAILLTEFRARARDDLIKKVSAVTRVTPAVVGGEQGYWVEGPHAVMLERDGAIVDDGPRLSTSSLLWSRDGVLLRLEADVTRAEAVRLAESIR